MQVSTTVSFASLRLPRSNLLNFYHSLSMQVRNRIVARCYVLTTGRGFRHAEKGASAFMTKMGNSAAAVAYNVSGTMLKLRGYRPWIAGYEARVKMFLKEIRARGQIKFLSNKSNDMFVVSGTLRLSSKNLTAPHPNGNMIRVFPVRAKDDASDISFW